MNCVRGCDNPATTGHLCHHCASTTRQAIRALPQLAATAAAHRDGKLTPGREDNPTGRRTPNPDPPTPSPGWNLADEILQWLFKTAESHADASRSLGPFRYHRNGIPAPYNAAQLAQHILDNLNWYATVIPNDIHDEATSLRRRAEQATGHDEYLQRIRKPCPSCDRRTLVREDGTERVICRNRECGLTWHEGDYDWLAHVVA
jgi:hypothetical protein